MLLLHCWGVLPGCGCCGSQALQLDESIIVCFLSSFQSTLHTVRTHPLEVVLARFFQDLCVKCVVSSAVGSHPQVLGGKQGQ